MKRLLLMLLCTCCAVAGSAGRAAAQDAGKSPVLVFDAMEHDFGRIASTGGKASFAFGFVNTGTVPVIITDATVSCKCTKVDYPRKPVAPGQRATITVTYDPKGQSGVFYKAIQVFSTSPDKRQIITIKGEVY